MLLDQLRSNIAKQQRFRKLYTYYPDEGPLRRELYPKHLQFFAAGGRHDPMPMWCGEDCDGSPHRDRLALCANRVGKALRNGTAVATPQGWRVIESLQVGDKVVAGDGSITRVIGVFPQGVKQMLRFTFDVGETIDCCPEHLWLYQHPAARYPYYQRVAGKKEINRRYGEWTVANALTILSEVGSQPGTRQRIVVPTSQPWALERRPVDLDAYLLGVLIGDGGLTDYVRFSSMDQEIVDEAARVLPPGVVMYKMPSGTCNYVIALPGGRGHGLARVPGSNPVLEALRRYGLAGLRSEHKRVPQDYLLNDAAVRLAMLQGLMDTDGSITRTGAMEFSSTSEGLAQDVMLLVHSLGGKATIERRQTHYTHRGERRAGQPSCRVRIRLNLCPFRLTRKTARWKPRHNTPNRIVHSIAPAEPGEATCIQVDHPSHTFVTAHGIVTHNSEGMGGYETALHLTGRYPDWWIGHRIAHPIEAWAVGKSNESTRDIIQKILLGAVAWRGGKKTVSGTGHVPLDDVGPVTWKRGVADLIDTVQVRHQSGGWSSLGLKSYEQGRGSFEGTAKDVIWLDEEPPLEIYVECGIRLMTRSGHLLLTFTPMEGMSEVVLEFLPGGAIPGTGDV